MNIKIENTMWADRQRELFFAQNLDRYPIIDKDAATEDLKRMRKAGRKGIDTPKINALEQQVLDGNPFTSAQAIHDVREQLRVLSVKNSAPTIETPTVVAVERLNPSTRIDSLKTALAKIALIGPVLIMDEGEKAWHKIDELFRGLANIDERNETIEKVRVLYEDHSSKRG